MDTCCSRLDSLMTKRILTVVFCAVATLGAQSIPLTVESLEVRGNPLGRATYKGHSGVHFYDSGNGDGLAVIKGSDFHNGTLEVDIAAMPAKGSDAGARGFAGLAFRLKDRQHYEAFYLRPSNGRADDQLRRNHS